MKAPSPATLLFVPPPMNPYWPLTVLLTPPATMPYVFETMLFEPPVITPSELEIWLPEPPPMKASPPPDSAFSKPTNESVPAEEHVGRLWVRRTAPYPGAGATFDAAGIAARCVAEPSPPQPAKPKLPNAAAKTTATRRDVIATSSKRQCLRCVPWRTPPACDGTRVAARNRPEPDAAHSPRPRHSRYRTGAHKKRVISSISAL